MGLENKVVMITGAARGIGAETARRAVAKGARVSLVGLEPERLRALSGELGDRAAWFEADVTDQDQLDGAVAGTVAAFGGIDVVLANAGVGNAGTVAISPPEVLLRTIHINLDGVVRTVCAALPHVTERRGYVMIVSSTAAFTMAPGMAAYSASKAAVEQFANCLRLEVAHKGVDVGSVHPGWIDTDLVRDQRKDLKSFDEAFEKFPWPLNATTSVEECADAIVDGMERRRKRVYVPRAIALVQALRTLTTGTAGFFAMRREAKRMVPRMEAEVQALGRYYGTLQRRDARRRDGRGADPAARLMATAAKPAAAGHRARLTAGLATAIAEKGYAAVTIADVVRVARVSKRTFYEHFPDKEACFLALYAETSDELLELIAHRRRRGRRPVGRAHPRRRERVLRARRGRAGADAAPRCWRSRPPARAGASCGARSSAATPISCAGSRRPPGPRSPASARSPPRSRPRSWAGSTS